MVLSLVYLLAADFSAAACSLQWFACSWLCFTTAAGSLQLFTCTWLVFAIVADSPLCSVCILSLIHI